MDNKTKAYNKVIRVIKSQASWKQTDAIIQYINLYCNLYGFAEYDFFNTILHKHCY